MKVGGYLFPLNIHRLLSENVCELRPGLTPIGVITFASQIKINEAHSSSNLLFLDVYY